MMNWLRTSGVRYLRTGLLWGGLGLSGLVVRELYQDLLFLHRVRMATEDQETAHRVIQQAQAAQAQKAPK